MKITYTEEAVADIVEAITYLNERNPTAAAKLDAAITRCVERLAAKSSTGPFHVSAREPSCAAEACRRSGSTISGILTDC